MRCAVVVALLVASASTAHAGRSFYGWLFGTEVLPERGVELATWIEERNVQTNPSIHDHETTWGIGPLIGITDQLELGLPIESTWARDDLTNMGMGSYNLVRYGIEARYRFVTSDPENAPAFVPLVRFALKASVLDHTAYRAELVLVGSYRSGRVHAQAEVETYADLTTGSGGQHFEVHPGAGVSVRAVGDLRFGAEVYSEISLDKNPNGTGNDNTWVVVGPNVAWTHGRFWASGMYGFGVSGIHSAPRIAWGIAF